MDRSFFRAQQQHNKLGVGVAGADRWATDDANEVERRVGTAPAIIVQARPTNEGWCCSLRALFEQCQEGRAAYAGERYSPEWEAA